MNVLLVGATGYVGSAIRDEVLARGHQLTAMARHVDQLPPHPRLRTSATDLFDESRTLQLIQQHQAVISAYSPGHAHPELFERHVAGVGLLLQLMKRTETRRLLMVGGAGSLEVLPGVELVDTAEFPEQWKATALATREALRLLRAETQLEWTFVSPAAQLVPGERTGRYRTSQDQLLTDASGVSRISLADYALALVDELEEPRHLRQRFAVAQG